MISVCFFLTFLSFDWNISPIFFSRAENDEHTKWRRHEYSHKSHISSTTVVRCDLVRNRKIVYLQHLLRLFVIKRMLVYDATKMNELWAFGRNSVNDLSRVCGTQRCRPDGCCLSKCMKRCTQNRWPFFSLCLSASTKCFRFSSLRVPMIGNQRYRSYCDAHLVRMRFYKQE